MLPNFCWTLSIVLIYAFVNKTFFAPPIVQLIRVHIENTKRKCKLTFIVNHNFEVISLNMVL